MLKLSIIIPMYNVAPCVGNCIRSLEDQDIPKEEYELICVNDGSPDNCGEIVTQLQKEYSNIILINQENQGVSMARNNAIDVATGRYLLFVDPDDYILPDTLKRAITKSETDDLDVLYLSFTILGENGQIEYTTNYDRLDGQMFSGVNTFFKSRGLLVRDPDRSWAILYKAKFLKSNQLTYPKDVPYLEDGLFLAKVLCLAQRCTFDKYPFYQRTTRPGSATHSKLFYSDFAREGFIIAAMEIRDFGRECTLNGEQQSLINQAIAKFVLLPLMSCSEDKDRSSYREITAVLEKNGLGRLEHSGCTPNYFHLARVYNFSAWLLYYYCKVFIRIQFLRIKLFNRL